MGDSVKESEIVDDLEVLENVREISPPTYTRCSLSKPERTVRYAHFFPKIECNPSTLSSKSRRPSVTLKEQLCILDIALN